MTACFVTLTELSTMTTTLALLNVMITRMGMIARIIFAIGNVIDVMDLKRISALSAKNGEKPNLYLMVEFPLMLILISQLI